MAKSPPYDGLTAVLPVANAVVIVVRALLDEFTASIPAVLHGDDTRAVHDMRVTIRRLRSALGTFDDAYPRERRVRMMATMRRIGRKLGPVRDADVHLAVLRAALAGAAGVDRVGIAFAIDAIAERRRVALADFAIELSQFDRAEFTELAGV
ncbi:MAG: hypothetical protein NVS4B5_02930 [Vulcanimicrobiaceae bacterium]